MYTLDGSGSTDSEGPIASYRWDFLTSCDAPPPISHATRGMARLTLTAETLEPGVADVTYCFNLLVTDDDSQFANDSVNVTVEAPFAAPVADAGDDQTVGSGTTVMLDGSGSTSDRRRGLDYSWTRTGGTGGPVTLSDASAAKPTFTADTLAIGAADVTHEFTLTVTDDVGETSADTVTMTVNLPNAPPISDAGPDQTVASGQMYTLDGSGSTDSEGPIASYRWDFLTSCDAPPPISHATRGMARLTLTAETLEPGVADVTYCFNLLVTDDDSQFANDSVNVTVEAPFAAPVADAGDDQTVGSGTTVMLDGSGSTSDRRRGLDYSWTRTGGTGGPVTLSDASVAQPTFTADTLAIGAADVTHDFTLTVTDDMGETSADTVTVTVNLPNAPPVADAGPDQTVASGQMYTLDGSGSTDSEGPIASYRWDFLTSCDAPPPISHATRGMARLTLTAETLEPGVADVTYCFNLLVTDDDSQFANDSVNVTVEAPFAAPVADAGDDPGLSHAIT